MWAYLSFLLWTLLLFFTRGIIVVITVDNLHDQQVFL
jgi:hypothetical protein